MASASSSQKKRKRDDADDSDKVSFRLSSQPTSQLGPVLVSFPALQPPKSTPFRCYLAKQNVNKEKEAAKEAAEEEFAARPTLVVGEADSVEFFSAFDESQKAAAGGCRYLVGVHNKRTGTTTLRPAPVHILTRRVKALKHIQTEEATDSQRMQARAALGQTFGTKKAKAAIRAHERNKVDVSAMEGVAGHLQERIEMNTSMLPTQEEAKASADSNRLIPPYDANAENPADVYPLHNIIPEAEWKVLPISLIFSAKSDHARTKLLPYQWSSWVNQHLIWELSTESPSKRNVKVLYYISVMMAFRHAFKRTNDKEKLHENLAGVPTVVVESLLARFAETSRGSSELQSTTQTEMNVLTHMFALCLRIDNYATETSLVAGDLGMSVDMVNKLFKTLGCRVRRLTAKDLKRLGLSDGEGETQRAVLSVPLQFPKVTVGKGRSRT